MDEPLAYERYSGTTVGGSGTALELFRNRLGSVILAVSVSTGAVAAEYDYDSFGQRTLVQGTEEVCYGFTSREHDALTGLIHYRARAYDPLTGQFLQRDPIGFASGDLNLYAYVENDPYNWTDPSGLLGAVETGVGGAQRTAATVGAVGIISAGLFTFLDNMFAVLNPPVVMNQSSDGAGDDDASSNGDGNESETEEEERCWSQYTSRMDLIQVTFNGRMARSSALPGLERRHAQERAYRWREFEEGEALREYQECLRTSGL